MKIIKEYKYIILITLMLFGLAFYWYSYRPYRISKICIAYAKESFRENVKRGSDYSTSEGSTMIRYFYWKCEKEKGLADN